MRIGLNAQLLYLSSSYRAAGINRYIHQLLAHLRLLAGEDTRLLAFIPRWKLPPELSPTDRFRVSRTRLPTWRPAARIVWEQLVQPVQAAAARLDLLHSLSYVQPFICPVRSVVTMLDLSFLLMPGSFNRWNRIYLATMARLSARRCDRIVTISESTRRDVIRHLGVAEQKVVPIHLGVDAQFEPLADREKVERFKVERGFPDRFALYLGTLEPRKNVSRLVEAYAIARKGGRIPHKLVLAGARGWLYGPIFQRVRELDIEDDVIFTSYIPYDQLPLCYNAADIFIYPSLYEGFGLPPLEAMACGTPVITSSVSSLPEVVGDAAITVDPCDVDALAKAIEEVAADAALRERLAAAGLRRAAGFTWIETAKRTLQVHREVLAHR